MKYLIKSSSIEFVLCSFFIYLFIYPKPVYAYLDPGTGSYMFQMMLGLIITLGFFFRTSLKRLTVFIKKFLLKKDGKNKKNKTG